jgi:hypothetical protein
MAQDAAELILLEKSLNTITKAIFLVESHMRPQSSTSKWQPPPSLVMCSQSLLQAPGCLSNQ